MHLHLVLSNLEREGFEPDLYIFDRTWGGGRRTWGGGAECKVNRVWTPDAFEQSSPGDLCVDQARTRFVP